MEFHWNFREGGDCSGIGYAASSELPITFPSTSHASATVSSPYTASSIVRGNLRWGWVCLSFSSCSRLCQRVAASRWHRLEQQRAAERWDPEQRAAWSDITYALPGLLEVVAVMMDEDCSAKG